MGNSLDGITADYKQQNTGLVNVKADQKKLSHLKRKEKSLMNRASVSCGIAKNLTYVKSELQKERTEETGQRKIHGKKKLDNGHIWGRTKLQV